MRIQERYAWEAETPDGKVITEGGELAGIVRFSLIPAAGTLLPRHDLIGVPMIRRFCRGFKKIRFSQVKHLPGLFYWQDGSSHLKASADLTGILKPGDLVGKGVDGEKWYPVEAVLPGSLNLAVPYAGISKPKGWQGRQYIPAADGGFQYVHCVVCEGFRIWVNYQTGAALITDKDQELYI